ncbi:MAG: hypothetical protein J5761_04215 [Paludibacteraceae bacterium]|nr:hypothetical protein [Paludibacteraceae bacterium]
MKKILSIMLVAVLAMPMFAEKQTPEERANVDYSAWLPQQGDFSIGFNVNPLATFVGNLFNGTVGNFLAPMAGESLGGNNWLAPVVAPNMLSIMGTYMVTDNLGIRANVGLGVYSWNTRGYVVDDAAKFINPYSTQDGLDKKHSLDVGASFSAGIEYRIGKRNVQGVFGAGLTYGFWGITKDTYSYYNAITVANQNPSKTADIVYPAVNAKFATDYSYIDNPRILQQYTVGGTHMLGLYGSIGVEWFVAPKIALGLNVNLLLDYQWNPARAEVWEGWNHFTAEAQEITIHDKAMQNGFTFTTDNIGANLYVAFYFGN